MTGSLPPFLSNGGGGAFSQHYSIMGNFMVYRLETYLLQLHIRVSTKFTMVFYNFCYYFWGQRSCWTDASKSTMVTICLLFISFASPSTRLLPPPLPLLRGPSQSPQCDTVEPSEKILSRKWISRNATHF